ncbi:MAG TPA: trehalose-phosphatase [Chloroflexota bacterium]|nr:trehalose-phosphatase [Chloroflexota bacterium]
MLTPGAPPALRGAALAAAATDLLRQPAAGLLVDLDGTLSPIAPRPELATIGRPVRRAIRALLRHLTIVAAISGRSASDARRLLDVPGVVYVGNHGMEALVGRKRWAHPEAAACRAQIAAALREVARCLQRDDVRYEPKGLTASIHYRGATDPEEARGAILAAVAAVPQAAPLRITEGRQVIELRPPVALSKGTAVGCLVRRYGLGAALYLGDDRTDLDAVDTLHTARAEGQVRALTVAVASPEAPAELLAAADGIVDGVAGVEALLTALANSV